MSIPRLDLDPFEETFLANPYAHHGALRDAGPVVWLEPVRCYAMARYAEVSASLKDWETFISGRGVGMTDFAKEEPWRPPSLLLEADPPLHDRTRGLMNKVASLASLKAAMPAWCAEAEALVDGPFIDIMLSAPAKGVVLTRMPGMLDKMPPIMAGTKPPSFGSIMTLRKLTGFDGGAQIDLTALDQELRALPVTAADKVARCARYDNDVPKFKLAKGKTRVLVFEKINGFRDGPSVDAARAMLVAMAERKGWSLAITDKGGAFNPRTLAQFDVVIWNNISGDVLTLNQRKAFQGYLKRGGGFLGMHGTAGDPAYFWDWYPDTLIGARFIGHPNNPQFQDARIAVDQSHPLAAAAKLPAEWTMNDEWYSFGTNPRKVGAKVLLTLDESTYKQAGWPGQNLSMGADHPLAWTNCIGKGRMFYSAIGHRPETYSHPLHIALMEAAVSWVATDRKACGAKGA